MKTKKTKKEPRQRSSPNVKPSLEDSKPESRDSTKVDENSDKKYSLIDRGLRASQIALTCFKIFMDYFYDHSKDL